MLTTVSYDVLLDEMRAAADWLSEKAQIKTVGTRFDGVYSNVQKIVRKFHDGEIEALVEEKGNEELWFSLTESDGFIRICSALKHLESAKLPRQTLKDMVGGPLLPRDETPNSAQCRNKLFELELAARHHEAGINITGFDDIQLDLNGCHIGIQCKRPFSKKSVRDNLKSAKDQIRKRHVAVRRDIIAFAIDKIYETDRKILVVDTAADIPLYVAKYTNDFIRKNEHDWHHILNTRIIGIMICMKYICHIKDINLLSTGFQIDVFDRNMSDYNSSLLRQIKSNFDLKHRQQKKVSGLET